jgi:long-chain acyl-CoA synthetase
VALPFFHSYGMSAGMNAPLFKGAATVLLRGEGVAELVESIETARPKVLVGVPATVAALVEHPGVEAADFSSLEYCFVGSAPLPREIREEFERLTGATLLEGYGLTEATTAQSANPAHGVNKAGSIGIPFPDVEFRVVDMETGQKELLPEKAGELVVRGPCLMKGYHNRPEETSRALRDGWLYTGDIAWMDYDGYFFVIDRKKDLVIAGAFKAYPAEVEKVLLTNPKIKEAAVVGLFDDFRGHSLKAFVVPVEGSGLTEEEVTAFARENLSEHKVPRAIEFREELPKNQMGKILRKELEQQ